MNQGKLEVVKQEMARVNVDILEISELKWTGMGEINSDDHYIYYCSQEIKRRQLGGATHTRGQGRWPGGATRGVVAAQAQEGLEELTHGEVQEQWR